MVEKSGNSDETSSSLEFKASVIPYDTCEDPNLPILASSGDDINLIFRIPKESFRKLAVAAIAHLGSNSEFEHDEMANGSKESENNNPKRSSGAKFRLSDVVYNLESENTKEIIDAYEQDGNTFENSKNKDETISADPRKLNLNGVGNGSLEVDNESENDHFETAKLNQNVEEGNFQKSQNGFENDSAISENADISRKIANFKQICDLPTERKRNEQEHSDAEDEAEQSDCLKYESNTSNKAESGKHKDEHKEIVTESLYKHAVDKEQSGFESENKVNSVKFLSDFNPDLSDCPELKNAWPNVDPFTETEEIPVEEMKTLVLNGFLTKYLKLELSNDFVVIKVTSETNVFVDAVKYKETEKQSKLNIKENLESSKADNENKDLSGSESECSIINADALKAAESNKDDVNSMNETNLSDENSSGDQLKNDLLSKSKVECATSNDSGEGNSAQNILERDSNDKVLDGSKYGEHVKIELEELDTNIDGSSPTERLKFALRESLKVYSSEVDLKETKSLVVNTSQVLPENPDTNESSSENGNISIEERCIDDSLDECLSESSEIVDSNEITVKCNETEHSNKESNSESESIKTNSKCYSESPEKTENYNSSNIDESRNEDSNDSIVAEKLLQNNSKGKSSVCSVEETKMESFSETGVKNSLEDSALGNDLHLSENEVLNDCSKLEYDECTEVNSHEMSTNIPCEIEVIKNVGETSLNGTSDNVNSSTESSDGEQNKQCEKDLEENCFEEAVSENGKLEKLDSLPESTAGDEDTSGDASTADKSSAENGYETNHAEFKSDAWKDVKVRTEDVPEILINDPEADATSNETTELESSEAYSQNFEKEPLEPNSEDFNSEGTDMEENLPENSFASNVDSFVDTTIDVAVESASECGDLESDDVKSVASESDDSKEGENRRTLNRRKYLKNKEADEVDCAPARPRRRKAIPELSKTAIPENTELKSAKASTLDTPSKSSGRISPIVRSLRSKSLDPTPQPSKGSLYDKKHGSIVESEDSNRRTRAKTPDVIGRKDIKTTARSSPRKLARSSAVAETSSTSKAQSTKASVADSKSRANLDASMSTKRSKRGSKE